MPMIAADDGCGLYYERSGSGMPVVLVPGLGGDGRFWAGVVDRLADRFDLIVVDHRGAGRSHRPEGGYSIGRIAADVVTVLDAEGWEDAHVVGHSTGGAIVQTLALDAPDRVRSLAISGSWARSDARFRALFASRAALLDKGDTETYQALTHVFGYDPAWMDAHEAELNVAVRSASRSLQPLAVTSARVRMLLAFDRADDLTRITQPTLVIGATDDALLPFAHAERLAALIPHAVLCPLRGGHFHPRTDPIPFAERVADFLSSLTPPKPRASGIAGDRDDTDRGYTA